MRILIQSINFSPELTGIGKYTGEMAEWLAEHGHQVRVVTAPPHYPQWQVFPGHSAWRPSRERMHIEALGGSLEVYRCPLWVPRTPRGWRRIFHLLSFSVGSLPTMLRQVAWQPDVVLLIAPTIICSPQALCVARLAGAVAWLHVQDFEVDAAFNLRDFSSLSLRRFVQALERGLMSRFHRASAISDRMVERLSTKGLNSEQSVLFPNWVDTSLIYPLTRPSSFRTKLEIDEDTVVALYSGSMGKKQGLELLMAASRRLADRSDVQFVFCGDGPDRDAFAQAARGAGRVKLLPLQPPDRLNELLNLADIHLLPQVADAADLMMPSKLTGMMASGRAVVATARAGTQLATVLDGCGLATPPGDVDAFVAALVQLAANRNLRTKMGAQAREYAIEHMGKDQILGRFEEELQLACGRLPRAAEPDIVIPQRGNLAAVENFAVVPGKAGDD